MRWNKHHFSSVDCIFSSQILVKLRVRHQNSQVRCVTSVDLWFWPHIKPHTVAAPLKHQSLLGNSEVLSVTIGYGCGLCAWLQFVYLYTLNSPIKMLQLVLGHWCTYSLSLHYPQIPLNMAVSWALLLMDCAKDVMKLSWSCCWWRVNAGMKTITTCCMVHTERQTDTRNASPSVVRQKDVDPVCDFWKETHSPASSERQMLLQTAVLWQIHYGTFQPFRFRLKRTFCTWICVDVSFFILHV